MPNPVLTDAIERLAGAEQLSGDEAASVLREVMEGRAAEAETAAFLIALRAKGESVEEIAGLARTMRELATPVRCERDDLLDTAGTGGRRATLNVSTTAALVAAAAGCAVAKHGNRSNTSRCGSADVLEALGGRIDLEPDAVAACIDELGFGFMFAPRHHAAMRHVVPVRKALGVRTVFNLLGPLTNPAGARRQLIGVSDPATLEPLARALALLGTHRALVVSSEDGLDEISASAPTRVVELRGGEVTASTLAPSDLGVEAGDEQPEEPGDPERGAELVRMVLSGNGSRARALVLVNAGAAIHVAGGAGTLPEGVERAAEAVDSGAAADLLERWIRRTNELAG